MATCNTCRAQYDWGENPCWRCGEDNSYWEERRTLSRLGRFLDFFGNVWGVMALLLVAIPLAWLVVIVGRGILAPGYPGAGLVEQRGSILAQFLAWFWSFIAVTFVYAVRFQLWNYSWIRNIRWKKTPALNIAAVLLFFLGIVLLLAYLTILMFYTPMPRASTAGFDSAGFFAKIIVPALYSLIFLSFSTASMLMAAVMYIARLNEKVGQPIYMNTNLLTEVVQQEVVKALKSSITLRLANLERTSEGGLRLVLNQIKATAEAASAKADSAPGSPDNATPSSGTVGKMTLAPSSSAAQPASDAAVEPTGSLEQIEKRYEVVSDEWAHIQTLRELRASK